jgi:alanyl-tRNA synthetase
MYDASAVKTVKLYEEDAYLSQFTALVTEWSKGDLVLDRTAFFPEEGGQCADTGVIEGFRVKDVRIRNGKIHHILEIEDKARARADEIFREGASVGGTVDFSERFSNMQQHSGEHLFSGAVHSLFGYNNVGFHLNRHEMTVDFDGVLTEDDLKTAELHANRAVYANVQTQIRILSAGEAEKEEYRSKISLNEAVRLVEFPGFDVCACCAPHVKRSGEIGLIKAVSMKHWKNGVRIQLLAGEYALRYLQKEHASLMSAAKELSVGSAELGETAVRLRDENAAMKSEQVMLHTKILRLMALQIPDNIPDAVLFTDRMETAAVRQVVNELTISRSGYGGIFFRKNTDGPEDWAYIIGSSGGDARELQGRLKEKFGARGGGSPQMIQGQVCAPEEELRALINRERNL